MCILYNIHHNSLLQEVFQPRDQTQVSHIAGGFFTVWATAKPITP